MIREDDESGVPGVVGRGTVGYGVVLIGGAGFLFGWACYAVFVLKQQHGLMWGLWGFLLLVFLVALADVLLLRVVVTDSELWVRRAWGSRRVLLGELESIRVVKGEYVVRTGRGSVIWIPMMLTRKAEVVERLGWAIAENVAVRKLSRGDTGVGVREDGDRRRDRGGR